MKEIVTRLVDFIGQAYWIKIATAKPSCTYYFGPFISKKDAKLAQGGFIEDLEAENAEGITISINRCNPQELTVFDEFNENSQPNFLPVLKSQSI